MNETMLLNTVRKAITDAILAVQDERRQLGVGSAFRRKDWSNPTIPSSVGPDEADAYRQTYRITAEHAAALVGSL